jgi:hypothetical protein
LVWELFFLFKFVVCFLFLIFFVMGFFCEYRTSLCRMRSTDYRWESNNDAWRGRSKSVAFSRRSLQVHLLQERNRWTKI